MNENYYRIIRVVGSWDKGTTIQLVLPANTLDSLLVKLEGLPDVETPEENSMMNGSLSNLARRFGITAKKTTNQSRRIFVTLKGNRKVQPEFVNT